MEEDPFDSLLNLEEEFYNDGYQLGVADGSRAGRIEGRAFGLENGFEKFLPMGTLHGRSTVWAGRLANHRGQRQGANGAYADQPPPRHTDELQDGAQPTEDQLIVAASEDELTSAAKTPAQHRLPTLPKNSRSEKHVQTLYALVEPASLSTENTEDAVSDFDDRIKRAAAKAKIIERLIGEANSRLSDGSSPDSQLNSHNRHHSRREQESKRGGDGSIEDISSLQARH